MWFSRKAFLLAHHVHGVEQIVALLDSRPAELDTSGEASSGVLDDNRRRQPLPVTDGAERLGPDLAGSGLVDFELEPFLSSHFYRPSSLDATCSPKEPSAQLSSSGRPRQQSWRCPGHRPAGWELQSDASPKLFR